MMPVISAHIEYKTPARFEDQLRIKIHLKEVPLVKMTFHYEVVNQNDELVCTATTVLAFMNASNRRPHRCPEAFKEVFAAVLYNPFLCNASVNFGAGIPFASIFCVFENTCFIPQSSRYNIF